MSIKVFANSGGQVSYTAEELCAALHTFSNNKNYIFAGIGNEMQVVQSSSSTTITVKTGKAIVCGRPVNIDSDISYDVGAAKTDYKLVLRIDKSRQIGQEGYITAVAPANVKSENLNGSGIIHDMILGTISTSTLGVSSFVDERKITSKSGGLEFEVIGTL